MYHLLVIVVAILAVVRGYRRGLTGQVTSVLGLAFGVVIAHILVPGLTDALAGFCGYARNPARAQFLASNLAASAIYFIIYLIFCAITKIVRAAMNMIGTSLLDSIIGAMFCLYNYMLMLSAIFNVLVGWHPGSSLMHDGRSDDGNVVALVLKIAPAALGSESFADFAHSMQLEDARKISQILPADTSPGIQQSDSRCRFIFMGEDFGHHLKTDKTKVYNA